MNQPKSKSNLILGALLAVAIVVAIFFWNKSRSLGNENQTMSAEITTLSEVRDEMVLELKELHTSFDGLREENDSVTVLLSQTEETVKKQKAEIERMRKSSSKDAAGMKAEILKLQDMRKNLTELVGRLEAENRQLAASNLKLTGEVSAANQTASELAVQVKDLKQLKASLEGEMKKLLAASTRASNFRVDILKRGDKPTGSHRRAKEFVISFDLKNVPAEKRGMHELYLVVTDSKGTPLKVANPIKAVVNPASGGDVEIVAQQSQMVDLNDQVRVKFEMAVEDKLEPGYYRASAYSKFGLLGASEFYLR